MLKKINLFYLLTIASLSTDAISSSIEIHLASTLCGSRTYQEAKLLSLEERIAHNDWSKCDALLLITQDFSRHLNTQSQEEEQFVSYLMQLRKDFNQVLAANDHDPIIRNQIERYSKKIQATQSEDLDQETNQNNHHTTHGMN